MCWLGDTLVHRVCAVKPGLVLAFLAVGLHAAAGQVTPPKPDTTRRDSTKVTSLPAVRTIDTRIERQIFDEAPNVGRLSVSGKDLSGAPRFFSEADLLRTIQLLPGVEARNDFNAGMNVRGGESDQNLVLLDGYPIYNPFHLGGLFGTFIEPTVGRVDLFTGAFPAAYGGRLSSVLDVRSAEEVREGLHGTANISLIASTGSLGSSFHETRGSWMIAGRRTYIDKMVSLLTPNEVPYDFRDVQGHFRYEFANGIRAQMTAYAGHDALEYSSVGNTEVVGWGNRVIGATVARTFDNAPRFLGISLGDSAVVQQRASMSLFDVNINLGNGLFIVNAPVRDGRVGGLVAAFTEKHTRTLGYELASQSFRYRTNQVLPLFPADSQGQQMRSASAYFDDLWRVSPSLMITAGARFDAVSGRGWWRITPRASAKYFINPNVAITAAVGEYSQWVRSQQREEIPVRPLDLWAGSGRDWPVSTARHYVLGTEGWINRNRGFRVEAFLKTYHDLLEPNPYDDAQKLGDEFLFLRGKSYGADFMLRQFQVGHFSGWLAYTFAVNTRTSVDGTRFIPAQDRRHDINLVGSWRYTRYTLGARYNLATGTPYSYVTGSYERATYDPVTHNYTGGDIPNFIIPSRNGERLPSTHRIDLSVTRNGHLWGAAVSPYLSIVNATNAHNVFTYIFDYTQRPPIRGTLHQLSIVPTIGMSIAW